jgi:hypothetical protein
VVAFESFQAKLHRSFFLMESVLPDTGLHVITPEPDRASASKRCIAGREDDLFVGAHAQNLMRKDQRAAAELLRSRS